MDELIQGIAALLERGIVVDQTAEGVVIYLAPDEDDPGPTDNHTKSW